MTPEKPTPETTGSVAPHPDQAEDYIALRKVLAVALFALIAFSIGCFSAYRILAGRDPGLRGPGSTQGAAKLGAPEIGIVDQVPFDGDPRLSTWEARQRRRLDSWGWVDRRRGLVHVPIAEAMDRMLSEGQR